MAKQGMRKYKVKDEWKHEFEGHTAQETMGEGDTYAKEWKENKAGYTAIQLRMIGQEQ